MFAFVDETGNTGANIFDQNQPIFFTAALVTKTDFDVLGTPRLKQILKNHNYDALHASEIGFGPIEQMAPDLLNLVKSFDARFFISRVEKRYLVATKFFDTFFDSGENPAVPWSAYNIRPLRLILTFKVASLIDEELARNFWAMLMEKSNTRAHAMIPSLCDAVLSRVGELPDQRSQQIVIDALSWCKLHPEALDFFSTSQEAKNGHMPNMVAFTNLMDGLEVLSKRWNRKVRRITHDRQSQFAATLAAWHRMMANASPEPIERPGETYVLQKVSGSDFVISASSDSAGIQIADLILWIFKRFIEGRSIPANSQRLLSYAIKKGWQSDFSFEGVNRAMTEKFGAMLQSELTEEQIKKAQEVQDKIEKSRLENVDAYEKDGLMPFER